MGVCESEIKNNKSIDFKKKSNKINICLKQIYKSICKIILPLPNYNNIVTGFLIKLYKGENPFFCLMTNDHLIDKEIIELNKPIEIYYDFQNKKNTIILNKNERFIQDYKDMNLDILIIEILNKDNINEDYFLLPYYDYNNIKSNKIYIPHYIDEEHLFFFEGEILRIDKYKLIHNIHLAEVPPGSPILLQNTTSVIGINRQGNEDKMEKCGNLINPIMHELNKKIINNKNKYEVKYSKEIFEIKGKNSFENYEYNKGENKNSLWKGKRKTLFENEK